MEGSVGSSKLRATVKGFMEFEMSAKWSSMFLDATLG